MSIATTLENLTIGDPTVFSGLTVYPLFGPRAEREYITLDEALQAGTVEVTELGQSGSVPELRFINNGDTPVFLLDGEEVVGAKQNRVLNLSVMAPACSAVVIPVSCVEQGRWQSGQTQFQQGSHVHFASGRSKKVQRVSESMRQSGTRESNQGEVWSDIQTLFSRLGTQSKTQAMADAFQNKAGDVERFVGVYRIHPDQTGVAFGLEDKIQGLDLFDSAETLRHLHPKLIRSWALDAIARGTSGIKAVEIDSLERFLARMRTATAVQQRGVGMGTDIRLSGPRIAGAALDCFGHLVHLAAFRTQEEASSAPGSVSTVVRASLRRARL